MRMRGTHSRGLLVRAQPLWGPASHRACSGRLDCSTLVLALRLLCCHSNSQSRGPRGKLVTAPAGAEALMSRFHWIDVIKAKVVGSPPFFLFPQGACGFFRDCSPPPSQAPYINFNPISLWYSFLPHMLSTFSQRLSRNVTYYICYLLYEGPSTLPSSHLKNFFLPLKFHSISCAHLLGYCPLSTTYLSTTTGHSTTNFMISALLSII